MIIELDKSDIKRIDELSKAFYNILHNVRYDLDTNPFSNYLLYLKDGRIVGYINYYLIYDKMEIANFNVLESFQNQGIGSKLLKHLIEKYEKNVLNITLEVRCDNIKAIRLYKENGFVEKAKRFGYYNGIDGILMERSMR